MTQIEEFRKKIANLFKAIVKLSPEICITYIGTTIQRVAAGGASAFGFHEVESILFLYFLFAEALSNTSQSLDGPGSPSSSSSSSSALAGRSPAASPIPQVLEVPVQQILVTVINSDISQYQNQAVQLTYFEVIVRYLKYMPMGQECFEKVIASFLDGRGIRSTLPPVRRRVNYLFQRFAKTLKLQLHPYVAQIIDNIRPILALDTQQGFSPDDQMSLYEALGNIVGSRPPRYPDLTRDLLAPLVARQRELLTAGGLTTTTAAAAAAFFKLHLNAITVFSKGFALVGSSEEDRMVGACFLEAMGVAVQVLNALPTDASVWTHVSTLLHRVIETLGALAAQHIAPVLEALLRSFNAIYMSAEVPPQDKRTAFLSELVDMLTLEGQVSSKFKEAAGTVVGSTLVDLLLVPVTIVGPEIAKYTRDFVPTVPPPSPSSSSSSSSPTSAATIFGGSSNSGSGSGGVRAAGEDLRELLVVHKTFMQCISTFMGNSGKYIMENRAFMGALPRFFDFVLCGLFIPVGANNNVQTQKGVVGFLLKCLDAWSVKAKMADFTAFANATVVPLLLKALVVRSNLAVNDASVHFLLEDCLRFLVLLAPLVGINEFAAGLAGVVLPGLSCPQQIANSFAQAVATCVMSHSNEDAKRALAMMKEMTKSSNY